MSKSKDKIKIEFVGQNSVDVTGSCIWIKTPHRQILLECGLWQTAGETLEAYKVNNRHFKFKPKEIDYVFICHSHADHNGLTPKLFKEGCNADVIIPEDTTGLTSIILYDSAKIGLSDAEELSKKYGRDYQPIYDDDDVASTLSHIKEYKIGETIKLDEFVTFKFVPSGHIFNSAQLELWVTEGNLTKKIAYTSDLGNTHIKKYYTNTFERITKADILIGESTYGGEKRISTQRTRNSDVEKLKNTIISTCINDKGIVLIPVFAQDRLQNMVTTIYKLFKDDPSFKIPVVIDTPMGVRICSEYEKILKGKDKEEWSEVMAWDKIKYISDSEESKSWQASNYPMVVLSSSGMMTQGRSRAWCKAILGNSNNTIVFCGFSVENSLASIIKKGTAKTIKLGGKRIANKCKVIDLHSFSSHMQLDGLLDYYSSVDCEKILLVHGEQKNKVLLSNALEMEISKKDRTSKVVCVNKDYSIII